MTKKPACGMLMLRIRPPPEQIVLTRQGNESSKQALGKLFILSLLGGTGKSMHISVWPIISLLLERAPHFAAYHHELACNHGDMVPANWPMLPFHFSSAVFLRFISRTVCAKLATLWDCLPLHLERWVRLSVSMEGITSMLM